MRHAPLYTRYDDIYLEWFRCIKNAHTFTPPTPQNKSWLSIEPGPVIHLYSNEYVISTLFRDWHAQNDVNSIALEKNDGMFSVTNGFQTMTMVVWAKLFWALINDRLSVIGCCFFFFILCHKTIMFSWFIPKRMFSLSWIMMQIQCEQQNTPSDHTAH